MKNIIKFAAALQLLISLQAMAAEYKNEDCLRKSNSNTCDKALQILTTSVPNELVEIAILLSAIDSAGGAISDDLSMLEHAYLEKTPLRPELIDFMIRTNIAQKNEINEKEIYLTKKLIHIFRQKGWQNQEYCLSVFDQKDNKDMLKVGIMTHLDLMGIYTKFKIFEEANNLISMPLPTNRGAGDFKYNLPESGICKISNEQIFKEEKEISERKPSFEIECPESAQSYQDRFKALRKVNDFLCFRKAFEREYDQMSSDSLIP